MEPRQAAGLLKRCCYEPEEGLDGVDWLGVDCEAVLPPDCVLDELFCAGRRLLKPYALPFGWPRRRRVR
jgi:hypothetical protein